jgi:hypothetical protein
MEEDKTAEPDASSRRNEDEQPPANEFELMIERSREWIRKIDAFLASGDGDGRPDR